MTTTAPQLLPYLERLLDGETVEWKTLGDKEYISIENNARKPVNSMSRIPGNTPYYGANNIQDYVEGYTHDGVYVLIAEDGTASVEHYSIQWAEGKFWANNHVHVIKGTEKINNRFLYYFLKTVNYTPFLMGGGRAKLTKAKLQEIPFAVPPLRVQARIVEILDKFTQLEAQLEAELQAELEARNKQYDFYRNRLLDFAHRDDLAGQVEWKTLGEVFNTRNGYTPSKTNDDFWKDGTIPWFRMDDIRANGRILYDSALHITPKAVKRNGLFKANSIILATSATIGEHALLQQDALTNQRFTNFEIKEELQELLLPKFAFYYFFIIDEWCKKHTIIGNFPSVDTQQLMEQPFPLPPLSEQRRIVEILDRFDTLTNSISEGLPREIALRRKQYEYYRDALLRFPPPAPTA